MSQFDTNTFEHAKRQAYWSGFNDYYGYLVQRWVQSTNNSITLDIQRRRIEIDENPFHFQAEPELYSSWHNGWLAGKKNEQMEMSGLDEDDDDECYGK